MILLDTNVLSALMLTRPVPEVVTWLDRQPPEDIWRTSITVFETRFGLAQMTDVPRADRLSSLFDLL